MSRLWLLIFALAVSVAPALGAGSSVPNLPAATTPLTGSELTYCDQSNADAKCTTQSIANLAVTSIATGCQATGGTITTTGTISTKFVLSTNSPVVTTPYAINGTSDPCNLILLNSGASVVTLGPASATGFGNGAYWAIDNQSGGAATLNITTSTLDGLSSVSIPTGKTIAFQSDGTNYHFTQAPVAGNAGTVTSITCPGGGAITTSGTCAVDFQTFCPSGCTTTVAGGASGTWTAKAGVVEVDLFACGGGGQGGGGATTASGTASSGGAGGGGGDCHWKTFSCQSLFGHSPCTISDTEAVAIGAGGTTGGQGSTTQTGTGAVGVNGQAGGSTTFGSTLETWFGGGGGGNGKNAATVSFGGGGASLWAAGATNSVTITLGCVGNGGGNGAAASSASCATGGGGSSVAGAAFGGGYSLLAAPGGESGGGVNTVPSGIQASGGPTGGASFGCQSPPSGGSVSATQATANGGSTAPDTPYHPGCGGGGGAGAIQTSVPGNGGAGTAGGGGGGGGSVCTVGGSCTGQNGGAGGIGGAGFLLAISR